MAWLLDTHVWLWSQLEPEHLGPATVAILEDSDETLYVSTISTLEIARLVSRGEVKLETTVDDWIELSIRELAAITLEVSHQIAASAYHLPGAFHRNPADRILVATALRHDLSLVTADRRILEYPHVSTQNARG